MIGEAETITLRQRLEAVRAARSAAAGEETALRTAARIGWRTTLDARITAYERRVVREELLARQCSYADCALDGVRQWQDAVAAVRAAADPVREVQRLVAHRVAYRSDTGSDHWQTPIETLMRGAGDCEDHALLKRELLLAAGLDPRSVALVFLTTASGLGHVVVEVREENSIRLLDNRMRAQRIGRLLPGDRRLAEHAGAGPSRLQAWLMPPAEMAGAHAQI